MIDPTFCRSETGLWRRLYKKLGRPHFDAINRGSNKGSKKFEILKFDEESIGDGLEAQKILLFPLGSFLGQLPLP